MGLGGSGGGLGRIAGVLGILAAILGAVCALPTVCKVRDCVLITYTCFS